MPGGVRGHLLDAVSIWLKLLIGLAACAVFTVVLFIVVGAVWYSWGFLGVLIVSAIGFGAWGKIHEKRERERYEAESRALASEP